MERHLMDQAYFYGDCALKFGIFLFHTKEQGILVKHICFSL